MSGLSDPVWIRTKDLQLRRLLLYPTELRDRFWSAKVCKKLIILKFYSKANFCSMEPAILFQVFP